MNLTGLPPSTTHGFHIHKFGNTSLACNAAGPHFNPYNVAHGGPLNGTVYGGTRHVGDLGNIDVDANGNVTLAWTDDVISLSSSSTSNIVGLTVMVHCGIDDYGTGSSIPPMSSNTTGNAGTRLACAIVNPVPIEQ